ncbi:MAG: JAB domain-containing protein [Ruminococcus sp.]|nr:JAB domain-containing protein [Ruminococcus sp.]
MKKTLNLREKLFRDGYDSLDRDEKLRLLLSYSEKAGNIDAVAERINEICGGTATAVQADVHFLMNECGANVHSAVLLDLILQLKRRCEKNEADKIRLNTAENAKKYFREFMKGRNREIFVGVLVNKLYNIKRSEILGYGSTDDVKATARNAVGFALKNKAKNIFISHCHPKGSCAPSAADHEATRRIVKALSSAGIVLVDHIITGVDGAASLRSINSEIFEEIENYIV